MKEALFICCNMKCLRKEMMDAVCKLLDTKPTKAMISFNELNTIGDGETTTVFALAENLERRFITRGRRFDTIKTCGRITIGPGTATDLYRECGPKECPRCGSLDREVRKEVFSDSSLYDHRVCGDQWHNEGKPRRRVNRDWTWH